ncbi:unnamed protein product [Ceutorhynchus assimilis]|uniref:Uncharacterized protein n=1 Tax=Ceutorhynchus assimilis TaxID=467358 RepID=A0A9N9MMN8_9CUCU|nr:unnamed protein product [Ceutorhynchus assimilis]
MFVLWCLVLPTIVHSMEKTSMFVKRSQVSDQAMSGSGYSYDVDDGKPQEYSFELADGEDALKILKELGYDPFESQRYAEEHPPLPLEQYTKEYLKVADEKPIAFGINGGNYQIPPTGYPHLNSYSKFKTYPVHSYPYAPGYDHASKKKFLNSVGKIYNDYSTAKHGDKVDTGYKTVDTFSKGLKGKYDNQDSKSFYDQNGGNKHSIYDNAGKYNVNDAAGKTSLGGSFGQKDSHNKGSKTTGFHKVYHKDDFNKQHKFYDKADKKGYFDKHGNFETKNDKVEGHYAKGASQDKGYEGEKYGTKDIVDNGKFDEIAKGFKKASGDEGFNQDYAGYSEKSGKDSGSQSGYSI